MRYRFAVIGNPIDHSLSPIIHQNFARQFSIDLTYEKIQGVDDAFERQVSDFFIQGQGLNVTLPFKQRAFALAQHSTPRCLRAGAANTLWMSENQLQADNTDGIGLIRDLSRYIKLKETRILVLGAGGAARGILNPLLESHPAKLIVAVRSLEKAKMLPVDFPGINLVDINNISGEFDLIINATSASLGGESVIVPAECWSQKPLCYDLAYQQSGATAFVTLASSQNCKAVDGLGMLVEQAAEAFFIWHKIMPSTEPVLAFLRGI